jgi:hypothetical protein
MYLDNLCFLLIIMKLFIQIVFDALKPGEIYKQVREFDIDVPPEILVSELRNRLIEEMPEFSKNYSKLYLLFCGKHLRLIDKTLLDYGVNENSTIIAYIRFFQDIF